jgi:hypothetical protein
MINTNSSMAVGSTLVGGRPHTPTLSTMNLQRTATSATTGLMPGNGGIAAQLSRVASRVQVGAATTAGEAQLQVIFVAARLLTLYLAFRSAWAGLARHICGVGWAL